MSRLLMWDIDLTLLHTRGITRAAYGAALPVKGASRRYATARRAALDREPPRPLHGRSRGQGTPCPRRDAPDNRRPTRTVAKPRRRDRDNTHATIRNVKIRSQDPRLVQNCYT